MQAPEASKSKEPGRRVRVWDAPVRIFHWILVLLIFTSWVTSEIGGNAMTYHMWSGYSILTLVSSRIIWGFVGSEHARFRTFVFGPRTVLHYARGMMSADPPYYAGHNPMGGWSVVFLLLSILVQATTGLFANDDIATEGPLAGMVSGATSALLTTIHRYNFYVILTLVCLHVAAALFHLFVKKENLIGAMFTGRKPVPTDSGITHGRMASTWLAAVIVAVVGGVVAVIVNWR